MKTVKERNVAALPGVLTDGEWSALLSGMPDQYQHLVRRLAVAHGALPAEPCPTCGLRRPVAPADTGRTNESTHARERATGPGTTAVGCSR
jgi:hypothetical protein